MGEVLVFHREVMVCYGEVHLPWFTRVCTVCSRTDVFPVPGDLHHHSGVCFSEPGLSRRCHYDNGGGHVTRMADIDEDSNCFPLSQCMYVVWLKGLYQQVLCNAARG